MAKEDTAPRLRSRWGITAAQAGIGAAIVVLALIFRLIGGTIYEEVRTAFCEAVTQDLLSPPWEQSNA